MTTYRAAVIGLGAMGMGMAKSSLGAGIETIGCDINEAARAAFADAGGKVAASADEAAQGVDAVSIVVINAAQTESVLMGKNGILSVLRPGAVVLGCATMPPDFVKELAEKVTATGALYLDAPISGGPIKSAAGQLSVMASGTPAAFDRARPFLDAVAETVFELGNVAGPGSTMKMVNQLLAGVHIATAMEAVALGIRAGLDAEAVYKVITGSAGNSWMFENRVPHVLEADYAPKSAVEIFIKDLGIVLAEGERLDMPLPISETALKQYQAASDMGLGSQDDASLVKIYQEACPFPLPGDDET